MPDQSTILSLPLIMPSQAQKHVTMNEALRLLDVVVQLAVTDRTRTAPPASPAIGARHIVATGATGAWAGQEGRVALWEGTSWAFFAPLTGWQAHVAAEGAVAVFNGVSWSTLADGPLVVGQLGVSASPDSTNRLAVSSPAILLNHAGAGHQVKINKAGVGDTASLLYQSGFSGRAEMGLAGSDDFTIKTSPNGATFLEAVKARAADGRVTFAQGVLASGLTVVDDTDVTKAAQFVCSGLTTGTTRLLSLPNATTALAGLAVAQTFTAAQSFTTTVTMGGGTLTLGNSSSSSVLGFGTGATTTGVSKTISIGTNGAAGSTTTIAIGPAAGAGTIAVQAGVTSVNFGTADVVEKCNAPVNYTATGTVTAAAIQNGIITYSGVVGTLTLPTGALLDALFTGMTVNTSKKFSLINTGTGAATIAAGTGGTMVGSVVVANGAAGRYEMRKTAATTYTFYRIA